MREQRVFTLLVVVFCFYFLDYVRCRTSIQGLSKMNPSVVTNGSSITEIGYYELDWDPVFYDLEYVIFEVLITPQDMEAVMAASQILPMICYGIDSDPVFNIIGDTSKKTSLCSDGFNYNQYSRASGKYSIDVSIPDAWFTRIVLGVFVQGAAPISYSIKTRGMFISDSEQICAFNCGESDYKAALRMCKDRKCTCSWDRIDDDCSVVATIIPSSGFVEVPISLNKLAYSYFIAPAIQGSIESASSVSFLFRLNSQYLQAHIYVSSHQKTPVKLVPTETNYSSEFTVGLTNYALNVPTDMLYDSSKSNQPVRVVFGMILLNSKRGDGSGMNSMIIQINSVEDNSMRTVYKVIFYGLFAASSLLFVGLIMAVCLKYICCRKNVSQPSNLRNAIMEEYLRSRKKTSKGTLNDKIIEKFMPKVIYEEVMREKARRNSKSNTQDACVVCLGDFEESDVCRETICKHVFHKDCLESWLKQQENCPFCRTDLCRKELEKFDKSLEEFDDGIDEGVSPVKIIQRNEPRDQEAAVNDSDSCTCGGVGVEGVPLRVIPTIQLSSIMKSLPLSQTSSSTQLKIGNRKNGVNLRKRAEDEMVVTLFGDTFEKKPNESKVQSGLIPTGDFSMLPDNNNTADITQLDHSSITIIQDKSCIYTKN